MFKVTLKDNVLMLNDVGNVSKLLDIYYSSKLNNQNREENAEKQEYDDPDVLLEVS